MAHISANVPVGGDFDTFLIRDLTAYFVGQGISAPVVTYELLRDGPTQSGVAYPKYYVWAKALSQNGSAVDGVFRVAAIDQARFDITDFVSRDQIMAQPASLYQVVPAALFDVVVARAGRP